jgi:hypothetical protein
VTEQDWERPPEQMPVHYRPLYRGLMLVALPLLAVAGILFLYFFDPTGGRPILPCYFYLLTGLDCVGCGTTRMLHALLHGDLAAAASYNVFTMIWLPLPTYALLGEWLLALTGRRLLPQIRDWRWLMLALLISSLTFMVLRNLPWAPFTWLAA